MLTDRPPAKPEILREFRRSDQSGIIELPQDDRLIVAAKSIESAMSTEQRKAVRMACTEFLERAANFYGVREPLIRVLAARPLRVREGGWGTELFRRLRSQD